MKVPIAFEEAVAKFSFTILVKSWLEFEAEIETLKSV